MISALSEVAGGVVAWGIVFGMVALLGHVTGPGRKARR